MKEKTSSNSGWVIVGISFIILALTYGVWYSFSVFFVALLKEFGWSRSTGAGAFSLFIVTQSIVGPFGAWLAGFIHDHLHSYLSVFIIMIACFLVSGYTIWVAAPRKFVVVPGKC